METQTTTTTNNSRSFPANYVTLAQLRERWLKERGLEDVKDDQTESDCVGIAGEEEKKTKSTANEEVQSPPTEVEARAGARCSSVSSASRGTRKWVLQRRTRERREVGGESRAEKSEELEKKPEIEPKSRVSPEEENNGFNPRSGHWSAKRVIWKRNGGARRGDSRNAGCEDRSENNCLDERDEIESGSKPLTLNSEIGTGSVSNVPDQQADKEIKNGVLAVSGWVRKRNTGIRPIRAKAVARRNRMDCEDDMEPKYFGYGGKKKGEWARRNQRNLEVGIGSKSENNGFDLEADIEPKVMVMSIHGGFWRDDDTRMSLESGIENSLERHGKDQSDEIRPELKALSVNEGLKKNGEKENSWDRKSRKGIKFGGGSSNVLDQAADSEPKLVMSVHGGFRRNVEKGTSLETGIETTAERNREEQRAEVEPESVNRGSKKKKKKKSKKKKGPRIRESENGQTIGEGRAEANATLEVGVEATVEEKRDDHRLGTETESRTLSTNEGIRKKNGKKKQGGGGGGRNMEIWQTRGETRPDSEPKVGVLSINDSVGKGNHGSNRNVEKEVTQEDEVKTKVERNGLKKRNKESKNPDDRDQLTVIREDNRGGWIRNSEKVESQVSGIEAVVEPEFKASSVIGGTRNEIGGFRRKTSSSQYVSYRESRSNAPGRFGSHRKVLGKDDGVKVWLKKEECSGGKK